MDAASGVTGSILNKGADIFDIMLSQVDLATNSDKYYLLQVQRREGGGKGRGKVRAFAVHPPCCRGEGGRSVLLEGGRVHRCSGDADQKTVHRLLQLAP